MPLSVRTALLALVAVAVAACSGPGVILEAATPEPPPSTEEPAPTPEETPPATAPDRVATDTVSAGRFDNGRMFTFDDPPVDYFRDTYGFDPSEAWFERARLGALRFATYCSASFVSPSGLILTNHHCARQSITQVSEDGEDLPEVGFYAESAEDERAVEDLFVEQLIAIEDVTEEVESAATAQTTDAGRAQARQQRISEIESRLAEALGGEDEGYRVEVVTLYSGGQYKAYTYKRFDDVRLVFAPEDALGYFGGDPDNFTYPRYSLDFALFRAYDDDGEPLSTPTYFPWSDGGTQAGDAVFVIGNPGSTTRLQTVAQLEFRRDYTEPAVLELLASREAIYEQFLAENPDAPGAPELRDTYFSIANGRKSYTGRVEGLRDPYILARRAAAERDFLDALAARSELAAEYGDVVDRIAANRAANRTAAGEFGAFVALQSDTYSSAALARAFLAYVYGFQLGNGAAAEQLADLRQNILDIEDQPAALQQALIQRRLEDFLAYLGPERQEVREALEGQSPAAVAARVASSSAFVTAEETEVILEQGDQILASGDPAIELIEAVFPAFQRYQQRSAQNQAELGEQTARLARARFEIYGTSIPPDATFTLRISDGVVRGYDYNGTIAPPYTTYYGLYDHYYSYCVAGGVTEDCSWTLPELWLDRMDELDLSTPYNFVSTNDIIGGNSGSPVLNTDLEVVGIAFDGNIQSLPGDYIFIDTQNRTVSVDSRGMLEALEAIYQADRIVEELMQGVTSSR